MEMLFSTSLVALILSPRRLHITNTKVRRHPLRKHVGLCDFQVEGKGEEETRNCMMLGLLGCLPYFVTLVDTACLRLLNIAPIHDMRIDVPYHRPSGQAEPKTARDRARGPDLYL